MDVSKFLTGAMLLAGAVSLSACGQSGSQQSNVSYISSSVQCESTAIKDSYVVKWADGDVTVEKYESYEAMQKDLGEISDYISYVEQDHMVKISANSVGTQATVPLDWGQTMVQAPAVWAQGYKGAGIKVAIVDTGVDVTHPQLAHQIAINTAEANGQTGVDDDGNGYIDDVYGWNFQTNTASVADGNGHGTHVSGIVAADPAYGPVKGIAPGAQLVAAPFMDSSGSGSMGGAAAAVLYAVSRGAKVINASWGGPVCSTALDSVISQLKSQGVLFIVAAGNGDSTGNGVNLSVTPSFPAALGSDSQITVGASGTSDKMAYFSNYSTTLVHLLAPGMDIYSTFPNNSYETLDGTSMATPFVAGAVAVLMSAVPTASLDDIKNALVNSVDHGNFPVISSGRMNLSKAVALLKQTNP